MSIQSSNWLHTSHTKKSKNKEEVDVLQLATYSFSIISFIILAIILFLAAQQM